MQPSPESVALGNGVLLHSGGVRCELRCCGCVDRVRSFPGRRAMTAMWTPIIFVEQFHSCPSSLLHSYDFSILAFRGLP